MNNEYKAKRKEIINIILKFLAITGTFVVAITAPNIIGAFGKTFQNRNYKARQISRSLNYLKQEGFISISTHNDGRLITINNKGFKKLKMIQFEDIKLKPQKKWDKKWRVVIFDIPERYKARRAKFRNKLKEMGLVSIQKSVWVCPYPCENELNLIKHFTRVENWVQLLVVEKLDDEKKLMRKFS